MSYIIEETYTKDGEERTGTKLVFKGKAGTPQLAVDESVTITVSGDPSYWNSYPGKFSNSLLCFFELEDGTKATAFVPDNLRAQRQGVTLVQVIQSLKDGDKVTVTRRQKAVQKGQFAGTNFDVFEVEPVAVTNGFIAALGEPSGN